jgi:four helix bundle protein
MNYEKLVVWSRSKDLAVDVYRKLTSVKDYGFKDQITRSILSVSSNIAEGAERQYSKEKKQFFAIAKGSIGEFKSQTYVGIEVGYINSEMGNAWLNEAEQISKMLGKYIQTIK